jgi:hypothetical protein
LSQVASAFVLWTKEIEPLARLLAEKNHKAFWEGISKAGSITAEFDYSGSVLNVLLTYWEEHGVQMPLSLDKPAFASLAAHDVGLQVCADYSDAEAAVEALEKLELNKDELQSYFNEFTHDDWDEAGVAMAEGWQYVLAGLREVDLDGKCNLLFVG